MKKFLKINKKILLVDNYLYPRMYKYHTESEVEINPLNSTGLLILSLCDGTRDILNIVDYVSDFYDTESTLIENDIREFLRKQIELGNVWESDNKEFMKVPKKGKNDLIVPYLLSVEVTNKCQLKCKHCYNESGDKHNDELNWDQIIDILKQYEECGGVSVMLTGGEVFLKPGITEIIDFACSNFLNVSIMSNGYTINEDIFRTLEKWKKKIILQISIDGLERTHDEIRGVQGAFNKTIDNIKELIDRGVQVIIGYTINDSNKSDLEEIIKYIKRLGCVGINLGTVSLLGRANTNKIDVDWNVEEFQQMVHLLQKKYEDDHFRIVSNAEDKNDRTSYPNRCGAGYKIMHLFSDGQISLCPPSKCIISKIRLGDLKTQKLTEVLDVNNSKFVLELLSPSIEHCHQCDNEHICAGCIVNMLQNAKDNCPIIRSLQDAQIINCERKKTI